MSTTRLSRLKPITMMQEREPESLLQPLKDTELVLFSCVIIIIVIFHPRTRHIPFASLLKTLLLIQSRTDETRSLLPTINFVIMKITIIISCYLVLTSGRRRRCDSPETKRTEMTTFPFLVVCPSHTKHHLNLRLKSQ